MSELYGRELYLNKDIILREKERECALISVITEAPADPRYLWDCGMYGGSNIFSCLPVLALLGEPGEN